MGARPPPCPGLEARQRPVHLPAGLDACTNAPDRKVQPWSAAQAAAVRGSLPELYRILVTLAAGLGLGQGEVFGLAPDDVDFLRRVVHVRRQVKIVDSRLFLDAPRAASCVTYLCPSRSLSTWLRIHPARAAFPGVRSTGAMSRWHSC
jgi:integrase